MLKKRKHKNSSFSLRTKILLALGILLFTIPLLFYFNEGVQLAFFTPKVVPVVNSYPIPTRITIPSVNIDLPLFETQINHGAWQIASDGISHLTISARPGEKGSIILYGHNTNERFGPIRWMSIGQKITLTTIDGKNHDYIVTSTQDVSPDKVSILTSQKNETLILYTCDGFGDLQRFVLIAHPI